MALVSGDGHYSIDNAVDLALASLSADERFVILERAEIHRVLEEQKLTVSGLVDATQSDLCRKTAHDRSVCRRRDFARRRHRGWHYCV